MNVSLLPATALAAVLVAASMPAVAYDVSPVFILANFPDSTTIDNPLLPLAPRSHWVYFSDDGDECEVDDMVVTPMTKHDFTGAYAGLVARVVSDRAWRDLDCDGGRDLLLEDTRDWYAQDNAGNVWYVGEDTTEYQYDDEGVLLGTSQEGSWQAGSHGAEAGFAMPSAPTSGLSYRQEYAEDVAEDQAKVVRVDIPVDTALASYDHCIKTKEWSRLEPGQIEYKEYCPGVGLVLIEEMHGKTVRTEAVEISLP